MLTWAPFGYTSVATTVDRSTKRPAWRMGDLRRQVSWLTAQTFSPAFPLAQREPAVAFAKRTNRLQLREQPRHRTEPHRVPFSSLHTYREQRNRRPFRAPQRRHNVNAKAYGTACATLECYRTATRITCSGCAGQSYRPARSAGRTLQCCRTDELQLKRKRTPQGRQPGAAHCAP